MDKKICPICNGEAKLSSVENEHKYFCSNNGTHISVGSWKETVELATLDWNNRVNEYKKESQKIRVPLKNALFVLLYDRFNSTTDMEINMDDEEWVDYIVGALIELNGKTCPYKNYDCIAKCTYSTCECEKGLNITCANDEEIIWKKFMII